MNVARRRFLALAVGASVLPAMARVVSAQARAYPARSVRIIVGFAAGGLADITARLVAQWLSERLGEQFIVENRTGGATNIATEAVVRAAPDGYTLLFATGANAINSSFYENLSFNFIRDIEPVASISDGAFVMEVNPSFSAHTFPEFIALAKANPGKFSVASAGSGTPPHVAGELFKMMAGVSLIHVPYRGDTPAIADLLGGQVHVYFGSVAGSIEHIKAGRLRPLAVTTRVRLEALPDIPTVSDFLPGFEVGAWQGLAAPKGTPHEIIDKLNTEVNTALASPRMQARFSELGMSVLSGSPATFKRLITEDTEKWAKVVKVSGAKPD
jgi:tripartite-type tricarboxylate transporter receptor subunit TctC